MAVKMEKEKNKKGTGLGVGSGKEGLTGTCKYRNIHISGVYFDIAIHFEYEYERSQTFFKKNIHIFL